MASKREILLLVTRFGPGAVFSKEEFTSVLLELVKYSTSDSPFYNFATSNLLMAASLDENTASIRLVEEDNILYPVVTQGTIVGL